MTRLTTLYDVQAPPLFKNQSSFNLFLLDMFSSCIDQFQKWQSISRQNMDREQHVVEQQFAVLLKDRDSEAAIKLLYIVSMEPEKS